MSQFNKILDPDSGISYDINEKKGISILQQYSDISGRTKSINDDFFKFREYEFLVMTNKIYPFLQEIMDKDKVSQYISNRLNSCDKNNLDEININNYKKCFLKFESEVDRLIENFNIKNSKS
jgi:hypothetical protein